MFRTMLSRDTARVQMAINRKRREEHVPQAYMARRTIQGDACTASDVPPVENRSEIPGDFLFRDVLVL
jgi:hypothetical protein